MGQVRRQAIKQSVIQLLATVISAIATITIYAQERELYGLLGYLIDTAMLFVPILSLGASAGLQRFYPKFSNSELGRKSIFTMGVTTIAIGSMLSIPIIIFFKDYVIPQMPELADGNQAEAYFYYMFPIALTYAILFYLFSYSNIFKDAAIPRLFLIANKLFTPIIVIIFSVGFINTLESVWLLIICFLLTLALNLRYLYRQNRLKFYQPKKVFSKISSKEYASFSFFSVFTSIGRMLSLRIDGFMVPLMFTVGLNGEYRIAGFIAGILLIPYHSIATLMTPMISQAWEDNHLSSMQKMYVDSSLHSLIVGFLIFLMIYFNLDVLLHLMPRGDELHHLPFIFLIIGLGRLADLGSGVNDQIIGYSSYYKFNFYLLTILAASNVALNLILGKQYGLNGIAIATGLSIAVFNLAKLLFIYYQFRLWPLNMRTLKLVMLVLAIALFIERMPEFENIYLNAMIRSAILVISYLTSCFLLRISPSWNELGIERWQKWKNNTHNDS